MLSFAIPNDVSLLGQPCVMNDCCFGGGQGAEGFNFRKEIVQGLGNCQVRVTFTCLGHLCSVCNSCKAKGVRQVNYSAASSELKRCGILWDHMWP